MSAALFLLVAAEAAAVAKNDRPDQLTPAGRAALIGELRTLIAKTYVITERRRAIDDILSRGLQTGRYNVSDQQQLVTLLNADMKQGSDDLHLNISYNPAEFSEKVAQKQSADYSGIIGRIRRNNYGYVEQRVLAGNVRYLKIADFRWVPEESPAVVDAAVQFLKYADAIIIDLRGNGGGDPRAVQYLISHFFAAKTELAGEFDGTTGQYTPLHTVEIPPARRLAGKPLKILIDGATFSAGEEFAYEVKQYRLGELVGSTTAGGANGAKRYPIGKGFIASVPYMRLVHPLTQTNWESTGVTPDVQVAGSLALEQAELLLLTRLRTDPALSNNGEIDWAILSLWARLHPFKPTLDALCSSQGIFGERQLTAKSGTLFYQRKSAPEVALVPLSDNLFQIGSQEDLRLRVSKSGNKPTKLEIISPDELLISAAYTGAGNERCHYQDDPH